MEAPLGFNVTSLIGQIINFLILFIILRKFIFKPVMGLVDSQRKKEKQNEINSKRINDELENLQKQKDLELSKARKEGESIIEEAKAEAQNIKKDVLSAAGNEAKTIIENAKSETESYRIKLEESNQEKIVNLAVSLAKKLLGDFLDKTKQQILVKKAISRIKEANFNE